MQTARSSSQHWTSSATRSGSRRPYGYCAHCRRGPREISYRHPEDRTRMCQTCSGHLRGVKRWLRRGVCPDCSIVNPRRILQYFDEDRQVWVCKTCFFRLTGRKEKRRKKQCQRCSIVSRRVAFHRRTHDLRRALRTCRSGDPPIGTSRPGRSVSFESDWFPDPEP
jgi:hypothetical protein